VLKALIWAGLVNDSVPAKLSWKESCRSAKTHRRTATLDEEQNPNAPAVKREGGRGLGSVTSAQRRAFESQKALQDYAEAHDPAVHLEGMRVFVKRWRHR
jgi:hypothetical protein